MRIPGDNHSTLQDTKDDLRLRQSQALTDALFAFINVVVQFFGALSISGRLASPLAASDYPSLLLTLASLALFSAETAGELIHEGPYPGTREMHRKRLYRVDIVAAGMSVAFTTFAFFLLITAYPPSDASLESCRLVIVIAWTTAALTHCAYRTLIVIDIGWRGAR